ncbi:MAG: rhodanese-like domain-containing protein [Magnetococcales bacterium]|nr:rhodanese-like domain-containing protein [Magnetococcales bacterium]MBF0151827.1 rhodanese-like domain-containing protein [Magnetococcales bacterium]MBF0173370.1 rhodanese-like domain-containing protein [Magnetococcales bacterium]MBF0632770.1 rhodanese-like domain-containing protein [Magnetococcales bacterium]
MIYKKGLWMVGAIFAAMLGWSSSVLAAEGAATDGVPLGKEVADKEQSYAKGVTLAPFTLNGHEMKQDRATPVPDDFKDPSVRKCKPFCVQPEEVAGATLFKMEDFVKMAADINSGKILIVDMRTPDWFEKGTIPGSVNLPYSDLTSSATKAKAKVKKLEDKDIIVFCNGWWCGQSPQGIKALQEIQYPGKIYWFRGGNQDWVDAGLPLVK